MISLVIRGYKISGLALLAWGLLVEFRKVRSNYVYDVKYAKEDNYKHYGKYHCE